ncbi:MAG: hypothetical protein ACXWL2_04360 [Candidatus Chromulinivorax sp.]
MKQILCLLLFLSFPCFITKASAFQQNQKRAKTFQRLSEYQTNYQETMMSWIKKENRETASEKGSPVKQENEYVLVKTPKSVTYMHPRQLAPVVEEKSYFCCYWSTSSNRQIHPEEN